MKRTYGTGRLYVKSGAYYGRWRSVDGRYRQNCESIQRMHISPAMGMRRLASITTDDVERLVRSMLRIVVAP
jgi:hypothetical protein